MKAGSKLYNNLEIPAAAKIFISQLGREYYIASIDHKETIIRFLDNGEYFTIKTDARRNDKEKIISL